MKKAFKTIYYIVLGALIFIALIFVISVFPITGNIKLMSVLSGSMEPTIHTGSIVLVKPISNYKVDNIVTFGKNTKTDIPTTHRIVGERVQDGATVYTTKGDANNANDNKEISKEEIIGKVYFSVPYLGYAVDFIKKPFGLMIVIVIPAVIVIYDEIQKIGREFKKMKDKKTSDKENQKEDEK
jgi:signal peptidase